MECPKCKGMMVLDRFSDFFLVFYAWKCMNCGAIIDRTIPIIVGRVWLSENPRRLPRSKKILTWSLRPSPSVCNAAARLVTQSG